MSEENGSDNGESEEMGLFETAKAAARNAYTGKDLFELVELMKDFGQQKEKAENELKIINAHYDVLRLEAVPTQMEDDGVENVRYEGIGRVSVTADLLVSIKGGQKEALYTWLEDEGLGDLVQPSINSSTLKAFVKRRIKEGKEYPQEMLNMTPITRASITKK